MSESLIVRRFWNLIYDFVMVHLQTYEENNPKTVTIQITKYMKLDQLSYPKEFFSERAAQDLCLAVILPKLTPQDLFST